MKRFWPRLILAIILIIVVVVPYMMLHLVLESFAADISIGRYYAFKTALVILSLVASMLIVIAVEMEGKQ